MPYFISVRRFKLKQINKTVKINEHNNTVHLTMTTKPSEANLDNYISQSPTNVHPNLKLVNTLRDQNLRAYLQKEALLLA